MHQFSLLAYLSVPPLCWCYNFSRWPHQAIHWTPPIMGNMWRLSLLLIVTLKGAHAQSQCNTSEICELENTCAISTAWSHFSRSSVYRVSCLWVCLLQGECMATTYDPETENCELHETYADGAPCIALSAKVGSTFSMMRLPGISCPQVRHGK